MTTRFVTTLTDDLDTDRQSPLHVHCTYKDDDIRISFRLRGGWHHCGVAEMASLQVGYREPNNKAAAMGRVRKALAHLFRGNAHIREVMYGGNMPSLLVYWATPYQEPVMQALGFKKFEAGVVNNNSGNPICLYTLEV